jgi:hypothetical protein
MSERDQIIKELAEIVLEWLPELAHEWSWKIGTTKKNVSEMTLLNNAINKAKSVLALQQKERK